MTFGAKKATSKSIDNPEVGTHVARLVGITDLGMQPGFQYKGEEIEANYQLSFTYELPTSLMADGRPHWVSEDMKNSDFFDPTKGLASKLMKRVYALDPSGKISNKGADFSKLLGLPCMVEIGMNDKGYPKIRNVTGAPNGYPIGDLVNDTFLFILDNPDYDLFVRFPRFVQKKIAANLEFEGSALHTLLVNNNYSLEEEDATKDSRF